MRIVQIAAEFSPIAKAGGLGEVILGLTRELTRSPELKVEVILPKHDFIDTSKIRNLNMEVPDFKCFESGALHANAMWSGTSEDCSLHLLEARHPSGYFHRGKIYGAEDDIARFLYFSRAALEYLKLKKEPIDILHLHDWHVAICAPLVRDLFAKELQVKAILFTIHNGDYQGKCASADLDAIGLKGSDYLLKEKLQDDNPAFPKTINLLKGGVVYSDAVTTVSPTYAKELLLPEQPLSNTFKKYKSKLTGILNGIDTKIWNPANDPHLPAHFDSTSSIAAILKAKDANKESLHKQFSLPKDKRPWIGAITRLVAQKGPELIEEALHKTVALGGSFLLLGTPDSKTEAQFQKLKKHNPPHSFIQLNYDDSLAHLIYGALDLLIVPSHFEPCGLTQLIALRYGTIPIVRATGGLKDTIFDCEDFTHPIQKRNGFVFTDATKPAMDAAIERAFHYYRKESSSFLPMIQRGMQIDFSWKNPAQEYLKIYRKLSSSKSFAFAAIL